MTAAVGLVLAAAASEASATDTSKTGDLRATIVVTNKGPLVSCDEDCGPASTVFFYIYVGNKSPIEPGMPGHRYEVLNAFVVASVDEEILIDGSTLDALTWTPAPDARPRHYAGRWPATVTCPDEGDCKVGAPAILPGETTVTFYNGWIHGADEPNGTYVFRFTIHGTLNGAPVDLTVTSPSIDMTD